jgi:copper ion binding protein
MVTTTYRVSGMTCQHCVDAVTSEVVRLPAVTDVAVDLEQGAVTVTSAEPLAVEAVRSAIDEAGFDLADPPVQEV